MYNNLVQRLKKLFGFKSSDENKGAVVFRRRQVPIPKPVPATPAQNKTPVPSSVKQIEEVLNDPSTPSLTKVIGEPAPVSTNPYLVRGYKGGGQTPGSLEYQAANAFAVVGETLNFYNQNFVDNKIPKWRRTNMLTVYPRAGVDLNAYYDGRNLKFFYFTDSRFGTVYAVDAADIVSHECGHSILDCFRPDLWSAAYLEVGAFHEFFGDFSALMHAMSFDEMINAALEETSGDLSKSNVISRLAEQFGIAIHKLDPTGSPVDCLRNAVNTFQYVDPGTLPSEAPDSQLAAEVHNFSRIMTGAIYDIFVAFYNQKKSSGVNPLDAVKQARDTICHYMLKAIQHAPLTPTFFASVANTLLWADTQLGGGLYQNDMRAIFVSRKILTNTVQMLAFSKSPTAENIVKRSFVNHLKLADVTVRAMGQEDNPLYNVELEMPLEEADLYDDHGNLKCNISETIDDSIKAAQDFIHHLHATGAVGADEKTPWEIVNGKLVRTRTCCNF